ncbi:MAG: zinc ribbon domain-containing protein [Treponemataceae bacterium]|nr:zinc ribbon domain-containing protein [Spirochaetales bacterium]MDY6031731.1 zinc ribbon domain-containing protein [Treponemataceae bacterium]
MSTHAKFVCENCQTIVDANAKFCPTCGKFFAAVKCPKCGKVGTTYQFKDGCPQCGYSEKKGSSADESPIGENENMKKIDKIFRKQRKIKRRMSDDSLPLWIYIVSFCTLPILIVLFVLLF